MFGKTAESGVARSQSLIQEGVAVRGDMKAEGDVRLDGSLEGSLSSRSRVIVGATGTVHADIEAGEVLVMGKVWGKVVGHRRVELRKGARVEGDLTTQSLVIEEGVFFKGLSQMTAPGPAGVVSSGSEGRPRTSGDGFRAREKGMQEPATQETTT